MDHHQQVQHHDLEPTPFAPGFDGGNVATDSERKLHIHQMAGTLEPVENVAYLEAMYACPQLVDAESDPLMFLRFCKNNSFEAATRLCRYWKWRKDIFGNERAFLPLNFSGEGALDNNAIRVFQDGYIMPLPQMMTGQRAIFLDGSRVEPNTSAKVVLQSAFAVMKKYAHEEQAQTRGVVLYFMLINPDFGQREHCAEVDETLCTILMEAIPIKVDLHFLVFSPKAMTLSYRAQQRIADHTKKLRALGFSLDDFELHFETSRGDIVRSLVEMGATVDGLPESIGGSVSYSSVAQWYCDHSFEVSRQLPLTSIDQLSLEEKQNARDRIFRAIDDLEMEQKAPFLEAMQKCPDLVDAEADPLQFLWVCDFDTWAAARRLCKYWTYRRDIFGPVRAFLPLDLTGRGALSNDDINVLQTGWMAHLPDFNTGQHAFVIDKRRCLPGLGIDQRLRVCFYLMKESLKKKSARNQEVLCLLRAAMKNVEKKYSKLAMKIMVSAIPFKVKLLAVIHIPKRSREPGLDNFSDGFAPYFKIWLEEGAKLKSTYDVIVGHEREEICEALIAIGANKEGLPESLGGTWNYSHANAWTVQRIREDCLARRKKSSSSPKVARFRTSTAGMTEEERLAAKRRSNAIHSRTKRERRKAEAEAMKIEHKRLLSKHQRLKAEESKLQSLLNQAVACVDRTGNHRSDPAAEN